jgi:hypothetical protein
VLSKPKVSLTKFTITKVDSSTKDETWKPVWGEVSQIRNHYNELVVTLADKGASGISLQLRFRIFDDGLGFRYEFPEQKALTHFVVDDERTQFRLAADHKTFWIPGDYDSNEYLYNYTKLSEVEAVKAAEKEKDIALKSRTVGAWGLLPTKTAATCPSIWIFWNLGKPTKRPYTATPPPPTGKPTRRLM